jgi:chorismate--pyruvate lyase
MRCALWHNHINHVHAPKRLRPWLLERGSLTEKLIAHCSTFRVQRLHQRRALCWADDSGAIGVKRMAKVWSRDVLLYCDERPAVYAHTVLPLRFNASQWPLFQSLGNTSLGATLFNDPMVRRGALQFARLTSLHPAAQQAKWATQNDMTFTSDDLFARRSLFFRRGGVMCVTEVFLPTLYPL